MNHRHWFQFIPYGVLAFFLSIMTYVVITAYTRHSGSTGLDISTIQKVRHEALFQSSPPSQP